MSARHEIWIEKYPAVEGTSGLPLSGIANARPETNAASRHRFTSEQVPFDVEAAMKRSKTFQKFESDWGVGQTKLVAHHRLTRMTTSATQKISTGFGEQSQDQ
jgi:hypothetical protein